MGTIRRLSACGWSGAPMTMAKDTRNKNAMGTVHDQGRDTEGNVTGVRKERPTRSSGGSSN